MPVFNKIGAVCALTALLTVGCSTVSKTVSDTAHALTTMHTKKVVDVNEVTANGIG
ncbi:superoxide dismutase family protein, partial [Acinetobacter baumannii]